MKILYAAKSKVWGSGLWTYVYFETFEERDAYVKNHDYTCNGGAVKLTDEQYLDFTKYGEWR